MSFLIKGIIVGFSVAAPVGPIGVLCIRRTLAKGYISGFVSGMGAATADAIYGAVAGFGITFISNFFIQQQIWLRLIGGTFLLYLGFRILTSGLPARAESGKQSAVIGDYASTFFLTMTNPATILSFAAIFAGLGLGAAGGGYFSAFSLVSGVFLGSALWWVMLSGGVNIFRQKISDSLLPWTNRISGTVIFAFGAVALLGSLGK